MQEIDPGCTCSSTLKIPSTFPLLLETKFQLHYTWMTDPQQPELVPVGDTQVMPPDLHNCPIQAFPPSSLHSVVFIQTHHPMSGSQLTLWSWHKIPAVGSE